MSQIKFGALSAAAHALRGAENTSIGEQVNFVSDALLQGRRIRRMADEGAGLPDVVFNVLENIAVQVEKAELSSIDLEEKDFPYEGIRQDLEVLEKFADQVIKHYNVEDLAVSKQVKQSISHAKEEAQSIVGLSELFRRIQTVENRYRNDPQMSPIEFKDELDAVSQSLSGLDEKIQKEEITEGSFLKDRLIQVKNLLDEAKELSNAEGHPGVMGGTALKLLLASAEKIQQARSFEELQKTAEMATVARDAIKKSSKNYQESGLFYEKLIQEVVANSVKKRIRELEDEMKKPLTLEKNDVQETEQLAQDIKDKKEKLLNYHKLASEWGGLHREELAERIALIYENINAQTEKMHNHLLEKLKHQSEDPNHSKISDIATRLIFVSEIGKDDINPDEIFSENKTKNMDSTL